MDLPKTILGMPVRVVDSLPEDEVVVVPTYRHPCALCGWPTCEGTCGGLQPGQDFWAGLASGPRSPDGTEVETMIVADQYVKIGVNGLRCWVNGVEMMPDPQPDAIVEGGV